MKTSQRLRSRRQSLSSSSPLRISCFFSDGGNHNQPVYIYIDYNRTRPPSRCERNVGVQLRTKTLHGAVRVRPICVVAVLDRARGKVRHSEIHRFLPPGREGLNIHNFNSLHDETIMIKPLATIQEAQGNVPTSTTTALDFGVSSSLMIRSDLGIFPP